MNSSACCFCEEFCYGSENSHFRTHFGHLVNSRIIFESIDFVAVPSLGPVVEGHTLVIPKKHINSFAEIHDSKSALEFISRVKQWLTQNKGNTTCFEHGTIAYTATGGCGITHAHLHVIPAINIQLPNLSAGKWIKIENSNYIQILNRIGAQKSGYLFFELSSGEKYYHLDPKTPSQYLRQHIVKALGKNNWDWRLNIGDMAVLNPLNWPIST